MKTTMYSVLHPVALALVLVTGQVQRAAADTTITSGSTQNITGDPLATFWNAAGTVTIENGATIYQNTNQSAPPTGYNITNPIVLSGSAGTITLRFNANDTKWDFSGPITSTATGNQIIDVRTGVAGNGDRQDILFSSPIPDGVGATTGLNVVISSYSGSASTGYVNLGAVHTFTGPITMSKTNINTGYLVIGGERYQKAFQPETIVPGSGSLGNGNYPGDISIGTGTILNHLSSSPQTLSGNISGAGRILLGGSGTVTLSGSTNITGNTTVNTGSTLVLGNSGNYTFTVTNSGSNKITGAGSATFYGSFTLDTSAVSLGASSWTLVDTTTKTFDPSFTLAGAGWSQASDVWTKSEGGKTFTFTEATGVLEVSSTALFNSFSATVNSTNYPGVIDNNLKTVRLVLPKNTNLATLAPTFTVTSGSCNQTSGAAPSPSFASAFPNPVTYTITDGATANNYAVTVVLATGIINVSLEHPTLKSDPALLTGPAGGLGETWNQITTNSASGLLDSVGFASGVGFTSTNLDGLDLWGTPSLQMLWSGLRRFATGTPFQVVINGLTPGEYYHVRVGSANVNNDQRSKGTWSTPNSTLTSGSQPVDNTGTLNVTTWEQGNNYVGFDYVQVDGSGHIVLDGSAAAGYRLPLNGFQLVPSGPPSAMITSFGIPGSAGVINETAKTITLTVPYGTNLATLAPTFTLTSGTCNQTSGSPPSPTFASSNPVHYIVTDTSTDPDTVSDYTVTLVGSLVIDLGTSPAGTTITGGNYIGTGPTNLPLPTLPAGSILRSIATNAKLEATDNNNFASDLSLLLDPTPGTPGGDFSVEITNGTAPLGGAALDLNWPASADNGVGTLLVNTKTAADWVSAAPIDLATTGLFLGNAYGTAPAGGTWSGTITLTYDVVPSGSDYGTWAAGYLPADVSNPGADHDGDGMTNRQEYAFGLNPVSGSSVNPIAVPLNPATGTFSYTRRASSGLSYTIWTSTNLQNWTQDLGAGQTPGATDGNGAQTVAVTLTTTPVAGKLFVRVHAN